MRPGSPPPLLNAIEVGFGLAPGLQALLDQHLPARSGEWYSDFY